MTPSDAITPNLWSIARQRLTISEEDQLAKAAIDDNTLSQGLLEWVQEKQKQCNGRRWTFKRSNKQEVVIGVIFEKIARWLQKFKEIGDVATQYDPVHAALPWAGVRMLLQIAINDVEALATLADGIETISSLITRCAILENIHLAPHHYPLPKAHTMLQDGLVSLYAAILAWLSAAGMHYDKRTIRRWLRSFLSSGPTLTLISQEQRKVSELATSLHDQLASTTARAVDSLDISFNSLMTMLRDLQQPMAHVAGTLIRIDESLEAKQRQQLVEWLSVTRHQHVHQNVRRGFIENTGKWLLQKKEYTECHYNIMASILMQLAFSGSGRGVHHLLWDAFSRRVKDAQGLDPTPLNVEDCQNLIIVITDDCPVTIIIDGLDESKGDVRDLLDAFQHIMDRSQNSVKLFISSREDTPVKDHLQGAKAIRITRVENGKDISTFIETKVKAAVQYKRLLRGKVSPGLEMRVTQRLTEGSGEMFLWASLNLQQLCGPEFEVEADVVEALEALRSPLTLLQTLEQIYQHVQRYESNGKQIANTDIVLSTLNRKMEGLDTNLIHNLCRGFVNCENVTGSFAFAHESIREFLRGKDEFCTPRLHGLAFSLCLRCLSERYDTFGDTQIVSSNKTPAPASKAFQPSVHESEDRPVDGVTNAFWPYAVFFWLRHYAKMSRDSQESANPDTLEFVFGRKGLRLLMWQKEMLRLLERLKQEEDVMSNITLLREMSSLDADHHLAIFIASIYGIRTILEKLERENADLNWCEQKNQGASSLYLSSVYGQDDVLSHLLIRGVNPNLVGGRFRLPIQAAAFRGHPSTVGILLMNGADPLLDGHFPTALHAAFAGGHESVIRLLVSNDACHTAEQLGSLIQEGFNYGRHETVVSLLRRYFTNEMKLKEVQDEAITGVGGALQATIYGTKNEAGILYLLEKIPDIDEPGGLFGNALQAACFAGSAQWVRLLLERGADPNSIGYCGSALRAASFGGHDEVVRLLLERGATLGPEKKDALEVCALRDHLSTLEILITHFQLAETSDYNECKRQFGAAMRTARRENRYQMVDFMLENGAGYLRRDTLEDAAVGGGGRRWAYGGYSSNPFFDIFIDDTTTVADRLQGGSQK
ncbi:ankyrin repeat protein [Colletotrichum camelliae]|nr:ankyrin repeat protein [Colletotrichum camelliae]